MHSSQFFALSLAAQQQYLYYYGEIIGELETRNYYSSLFLLDNFYVEVFLCKHTEEVTEVRHQDNAEILMNYLERLELPVQNLAGRS